MVIFIEELLKATASQDDPKQRYKRRPGRGVTGLLHHLSKKIAVLVRLATLFAGVKQISKSLKLDNQIEFLVFVLRGTMTFSQQHVVDFEQLLAMISEQLLLTAKSRAIYGSVQYQFYSYSKDKVDMSVPLQQLRTHWQMCMTCGKLVFGLKVDHTKCEQKECDAFLEKPLFAST